MSIRHALAAIALFAVACGGGSAEWRARAVAIPEPDLERHDPATRAKLQEARARTDAAVAARDATASSAAAAFGELGRLYFAHDAWRSAEASLGNAATLAPDDRHWPYLLGVLAQMEGRPDVAAERFERAVELARGDGPTLIRLAQVEFDLGRGDASRRHYDQAAAIGAVAPAAEFGLGRSAAADGDHAAAVGHFEKALAAQPTAGVVHNALGLALRRLGRRDEAQQHLARAGTTPVAFPDPVVDALSDLVTSAHSYVQRGDQARTAGNLEQAIREYRQAVQADPALAVAQFQLGTALGERGDLAGAIEHLQRATTIDPNYKEALSNLATAAIRSDKPDEALAALDRLVALDPASTSALLRRSALRRDRGEIAAARTDLDAILAREPRHPDAIADLAVLLARTGKAAEAERMLRKALAGDPPADLAARAHATLAFLRTQKGDAAGALEEYRRAARANPDDADARFSLGVALHQSRRHGEAADAFAEAARLSPANVQAHLGLARARIAAGHWALARAALEAGLVRVPGDLVISSTLAEVLSGSPDASVRDGERALQLANGAYQANRGADHAEAVAMALAELGRFDEAAGFQRQLLADAEKANVPPNVRTRLAKNLARYERREPVRIGR